MRTAVLDTSIEAHRALLNKPAKSQADRVEAIVKASGTAMSLQEIKAAYNHQHPGHQIDLSSVSGRVNALIAAKRLQRLEFTRDCKITGKAIHPVQVPPKQGVLFS